MMKTNNEMSATPSYTAPVAKLINAKLEGLICQSGYGDANEAGDVMQETQELNW